MLPKQLFDLLDQNTALCYEFIPLLRQEEEALRRIDVHTIQQVSRRKDELLSRINCLDAGLNDLIARICGERPAPAPRINRPGQTVKKIALDRLPPYASPEQAKVLAEKTRLFKKIRADIFDRNLINRRFIADVLGFIKDSITMLNNTIATEVGYGAGALPGARPQRRSAFISREV